MFPILVGKMAERNVNHAQMAKVLGISPKAFSNKINGKTDFKWSEAKAIRDYLGPDLQLEELFKTK